MTLVDEATSRRVGALIERLASAGETLAVAESLTGGLLCSTLVHPAGASRVVRGGVVAYATDAKASFLDVDPSLLSDRGAVDPDVALAMARGVRERFGASIGIATTGVAGPDVQGGVAAGTAYIALDASTQQTPIVEKVHIDGTRDDVRWGVVVAALNLLENSLRVE